MTRDCFYPRRPAALVGLAALGGLACVGTPAEAHPHAWIDVRSTVVSDDEGQITAIEQEWLFDNFYLSFATKGLPRSPAALGAALKDLARTNLTQLEPYGYFLDVRADGAKQAVKTVEEFETKLWQQRLWLRFVVPLAAPIDPKQHKVAFSVFDPTYYIEMLHVKDEPVAVRGAAACSGKIVPPTPPKDAVALASSLDRGATAGDWLGQLFAEKVEIECQ